MNAEIEVGDHLYRVDRHPSFDTFTMLKYEVIKVMKKHLDIQMCNINSTVVRIRQGGHSSLSLGGRPHVESFSRTPEAARHKVLSKYEKDRRTGLSMIETAEREIAELETDLPMAAVEEK